jgi:hypothetical protein
MSRLLSREIVFFVSQAEREAVKFGGKKSRKNS